MEILRQIGRWAVRGLIAVLPLAITLYVLVWVARLLEAPGEALLLLLLPDNWVKPGMGLLLGLVVLIGIGILTRLYIAQKLLHWSDRVFERIPVAKTVYGSVKDIMKVFTGGEKRKFSEVVLVRMPNSEMRLLGTVTRRGFEEFGEPARGMVGVYLPMSYQIGGFLVMVPESEIEKVDMMVEQALKFAMTAGLSSTGPVEVTAGGVVRPVTPQVLPGTPPPKTGGKGGGETDRPA